jgi:hypothetical protein
MPGTADGSSWLGFDVAATVCTAAAAAAAAVSADAHLLDNVVNIQMLVVDPDNRREMQARAVA